MAKAKKPTTRHLKPKNHAIIAMSSLAVLAVASAIANKRTFDGLEYSIFNLIYSLPDFLNPLFLTITQFGSAWWVVILTLVTWAQKIKGLPHKILINGAITYFAAEYLKDTVGRARPEHFYPTIVPREGFDFGSGFPSGHTAMATVLALTIMPYLPKKYLWIVPVWIGGVAVSRIYLGVHAPLDVVGGFALGVLIASLQHYWTSKREVRKQRT